MKYLLCFLTLLLPALGFTQGEKPIVKESYTKEIRELLKNSRLQKAFEAVKAQDEKTIADLILLNEIEAPPFEEEKRALQFAAMLKAEGVDSVWIDTEGNVLALRKGTEGGKTVVLDAHLDTVFPAGTDVKVRISGDTLFCSGHRG